MGQDLTTSSTAALPAIDVTDPGTMLLIPDWLGSQLSAVSDLGAGRTVLDTATGQITKRVATIPKSKMPTGAQRRAIERRISELRWACEPGPQDTLLMHVGELIKEYAPGRIDDAAVSIKADAYLDALEDLPAWAVREAIRRWRRGDVSADAQTLDFAPRPARLRAIAERVALVARGQAGRLQRILDAEPETELSDAEAAENIRRVAHFRSAPIRSEPQDVMRPPVGSAHADRLSALSTLKQAEAKAKSEQSEGVKA